VWDLTANACSCELVPEVGTAVRSLTVALDGSMIVAGNNHGTCYVWRMLRGTTLTTHFEPLHKLRAHGSHVLKCLISPDVQQLATTSSDKTVKLWNLDGFGLDRTLTGHTRWVWDAVFSVDAAYLVTASSDATARLWDLGSGGPGVVGGFKGFSGRRPTPGSGGTGTCRRSGRRGRPPPGNGSPRPRAPRGPPAGLTPRAPPPAPTRPAGEAIRTYSGHHKAIVCCALNDSAIDA
jgi:WD40 repeat protein